MKMRDCAKCIHNTTPGSQYCNIGQKLREMLGDKPYIPENVIPALQDIAKFCEWYEESE